MTEKKKITEAEIVQEPETALARVNYPGELRVSREPALILEEAQKAAQALMSVVEGKKKKVTMNGKTYLEFEDWLTVARFYGVSVKVADTRFVELGETRGFEARAEVLLVSNGLVISAADAMCLDDEEHWGERPKYEWRDKLDKDGKLIWKFNKEKQKNLPEKERVQTGTERVPLFQLRSMAQTRACAKALRNVLAFVPVLAGYAPTPAEEMSGMVTLGDALEEGKRQAEAEAAWEAREKEGMARISQPAAPPPAELKPKVNMPPAKAAATSRGGKEIKKAIQEKAERDPAVITIAGTIQEAKKLPFKDKPGHFIRLTLGLPGKKSLEISVFDNKEYPGGETLFQLLQKSGGEECSLVIRSKGEFINMVRPVKIGSTEFDDDGIPFLQRKEDLPPDLPDDMFYSDPEVEP